MQMPGDGWRDAHDYIASTVFDLISLDGGVTATGVLSRQRGNLITIGSIKVFFCLTGPYLGGPLDPPYVRPPQV